jgi:hypothetical protein
MVTQSGVRPVVESNQCTKEAACLWMSAVYTERHMPPQLYIYSENFSGEGLFTHTTAWDLRLHRRMSSATLNTYGLGLPFNHECNRPL